MTNHTETQEGYGVLVTRKDGTRYLATDDRDSIFIADLKGWAELEINVHWKEHTTEVVRIRATWEVVK